MRTLRYLALLSLAVAAFAQDKPSDTPSPDLQPKIDWKTSIRGPDGTFQFRALPDAATTTKGRRLPPDVAERFLGGNICYYIRSYAVKRVDGTDETVPAGETTCTPASRFQLRRSAPRK